METCYEYFNCKKQDCIMFGLPETKCWEEESTLCIYPPMVEEVLKKSGLDKCSLCLYKKSVDLTIKH